MAKVRSRGNAYVFLFKDEEIYETLMLVSWNRLFQHLVIREKGVVLKVRIDTVQKEVKDEVRYPRFK